MTTAGFCDLFQQGKGVRTGNIDSLGEIAKNQVEETRTFKKGGCHDEKI